jgi:hypothetical protein
MSKRGHSDETTNGKKIKPSIQVIGDWQDSTLGSHRLQSPVKQRFGKSSFEETHVKKIPL